MMNEILVESLSIMASYIILVVALIIALNWLQRNFLWAFIRVRASRGSKVLIEIHGLTDNYFKIGDFDSTNITFKNKKGDVCLLAGVEPSCIIPVMGVHKIEYDEVNKCLWTREGAVIAGNDPVHVDQLIKRAMEGAGSENKLLKVLVILFIIGLLVTITGFFLIYKMYAILQTTNLANVIV